MYSAIQWLQQAFDNEAAPRWAAWERREGTHILPQYNHVTHPFDGLLDEVDAAALALQQLLRVEQYLLHQLVEILLFREDAFGEAQ